MFQTEVNWLEAAMGNGSIDTSIGAMTENINKMSDLRESSYLGGNIILEETSIRNSAHLAFRRHHLLCS
jgi:hypothetical protein